MATYPVSFISAVLLPDGWHQVTVVAGQSPALDYDVELNDPVTGISAVPVGGPWLRFIDEAGTTIMCPLSRVEAVKHAP